MFESIDEKKSHLHRFGDERRDAFGALKHKLDAEWTFQEMAISGTPLARMDVRRMMDSRVEPVIRARILREAHNFYRATQLINRFVIKTPEELGEEAINALHTVLLKGIDESIAAVYRTGEEAEHEPEPGFAAPAEEIAEQISDAFRWLSASATRQHAIRQATELHLRIMYTQPYRAMNGRVGRLLMNLVLMQRGLPPSLLIGDERAAYGEAIHQAPRDGGLSLARLIAQGVERGLDFCIDVLDRTPVVVAAVKT